MSMDSEERPEAPFNEESFKESVSSFINKEVSNAVCPYVVGSNIHDFHKAARNIMKIMGAAHEALEESITQALTGFLLNLEANQLGK